MRAYLRILSLTLLASGLAPLVTLVASSVATARFVVKIGLLTSLVLALAAIFDRALVKFQPYIDRNARSQAIFLRSSSERYVSLAIFGSAALSLFLELSIIRWQASVFEFFAFYKNFSLLSCFLGLGLGYALAGSVYLPLPFTIPLLAWQFFLLLGMRYRMPEEHLHSLRVLPITEQLNMGLVTAKHFYLTFPLYGVLAVVFLLTVLAFMPIGQVCGVLMERRPKLPAYGLNLLGSLAGVLIVYAISAFWTPPLVWFALAFAGILVLCVPDQFSRTCGLISATTALLILAWPTGVQWQKIYSPYQLLEVGRTERGLMYIRAAGHYYQRVHDLSFSNRNVETDPDLRAIRNYYEFPYAIYGSPGKVAIVGAGTGNDVAAALRSGAKHIDAIEIDPAILTLGRDGHPEHPYADPRVRAIVNDARSFLRTTDQTYDMIVYGLLDSHTLLSHASSVRLDSFVYTVEGLRDASRHLNPGGVLSLSFSMLNPKLGRKIFLMMQQAFDGRPPVCVTAGYDGGVIFLASKDRDISLPRTLLARSTFQDSTTTYGNPVLEADVSTDDWPFFYMPLRVYPFSYLGMIVLILFLSTFLVRNFVDDQPSFSQLEFFLLGAGFMLIETKGITELGLMFGNSWQVIGIVIASLMVMAFLANLAVLHLNITRPVLPYVFLLCTLLLGWTISGSYQFSSTWLGHLFLITLITSPMFFSGIVFSTLLGRQGNISGIMASNLLGAMFGGLLEYNSMYFGLRFLYLLAALLYGVAFTWNLFEKESREVVGATHLQT